MQCSFAVQKPAFRQRRTSMKPWGLLVHTSGRGIGARAKAAKRTDIELALEWYRDRDQSGVHYVVDHDGTIYQMLDDDRVGAHVGISLKERLSYISGRWIIDPKIKFKAVMFWKNRWPGYKSPQHLYPTGSPNKCYIGVEMLPLAEQREDGLWFTDAQHTAIKMLAADLAARHLWPKGWMNTPRLVGHEDVDAFARWDAEGGWDPGAMRLKPRFSWARVKS